MSVRALPPTSPDLARDDTRPYFLWWTDLTIGQFRDRLRSDDSDERAYWIGALMREANTRDVWQFVSPDEIRRLWAQLQRHLGRTRELWTYLLDLPALSWPPPEARGA